MSESEKEQVIADYRENNLAAGSLFAEASSTRRELQSCLAFLGYYLGAIDGQWGEDSRAAAEVARADYSDYVETCKVQGWMGTYPCDDLFTLCP